MPTLDKLGRVAAFEVMHANIAIKNLIREGKTHQIEGIMQTYKKDGMITMDDALFDLYIRGEISAESALSFSQDMAYLDKKINNLY